MAAIDFPSSPSTNQIFTANDTSWIWDGITWVAYQPTSGNLIFNAGTLDAGVVSTGSGSVRPTSVLPNGLPSPIGNAGLFIVSNGSAWVSGSGNSSGFSNIQVFTSSGTFTVPAGITKVKVTVIGGGGGGGGSQGSGGGAGGASIEIISGLTPGNTVTVTVGTGGAGGPSSGATDGVAGGTSSFGAFCSATGGSGGSVSSGSQGGIGSGGNLNIRGGPSTGFISVPCYSSTGSGGNSILGGGGAGTVTTGNAGGAYGGGGAGSNGDTGGAGAAGVVIVEW